MKYTEINIKADMPVVADAMRYLRDSIIYLNYIDNRTARVL